MQLKELVGYDLGSHNVTYAPRDAILYALAVGAAASQLDLVYERDLRVLPTYANALGLWAVEKAGDLGAYDRKRSLHASQALQMHGPLPREGTIEMSGRIKAVWDKGKATIVDVVVDSSAFTATYTLFLPGLGNWGGSPGPSTPKEAPPTGPAWQGGYPTSPNLAALYRLTGDLHPIHIDPELAGRNGFERPILHGLCTLGIAARMVAEAAAAHPCDLQSVKARLSAPVLPGETVNVTARTTGVVVNFEAEVAGRAVLNSGQASFS